MVSLVDPLASQTMLMLMIRTIGLGLELIYAAATNPSELPAGSKLPKRSSDGLSQLETPDLSLGVT